MNTLAKLVAWAQTTNPDEGRRRMLLYFLLASGAISLLFHASGLANYDSRANLWAGAVMWLLVLGVPWRAAYAWICHLALLTALLLLSYIAMQTGGINSPALVWMTVLAVPALLLLGVRWAWLWVGVVLLALIWQFFLVKTGQVVGLWDDSLATLWRSVLDKVMVTVGLMWAVWHYERLQQQHVQSVEANNVALEQTQAALQQAQSHQDEFIASVGHELRTPMNAILGLNEVLQNALQAHPQAQDTARHIRQSTEQLLALVNDILDFSRLEAGRLQWVDEPVDMVRCLQQTLAPWMARAAAKGVQLRLHLDPQLPRWIWTDAHRMPQILSKLVDNAVKFTAQGRIDVRLQQSQGLLRLEVQDSGVGIAPERQAEIFKRFEHADVDTQRAFGGTGLGLAICEHLVRLQQGRMGVNSLPGAGALFWVELPLRSASAPDPDDATRAQAEASAPWRFLLVDDNATNLLVAKLALQKVWPQALLTTAASGPEALALLDTQGVDLVFMDMLMPDMDGLEATRQLRRHPDPRTAHLPVIGLTANHDETDRQQCLAAGMNDVLFKPLDEAALRRVVQRWAPRRVSGEAP